MDDVASKRKAQTNFGGLAGQSFVRLESCGAKAVGADEVIAWGYTSLVHPKKAGGYCWWKLGCELRYSECCGIKL